MSNHWEKAVHNLETGLSGLCGTHSHGSSTPGRQQAHGNRNGASTDATGRSGRERIENETPEEFKKRQARWMKPNRKQREKESPDEKKKERMEKAEHRQDGEVRHNLVAHATPSTLRRSGTETWRGTSWRSQHPPPPGADAAHRANNDAPPPRHRVQDGGEPAAEP
ncbi:hypothetical protein NEUTE2DRAFT_133204 [Neurospora tetrasperma FGSC 2509]|nr:hypothetical protein NEUTE2DRAFT_133204 [Neurospora tetrasperma FGSC 2509]